MKKTLLFVIFTTSIAYIQAQSQNTWQVLDNQKVINSEKIREVSYSENQKLLQLNSLQFKQLLANVATKDSGLPGVEISFPNIEGELEKFIVWESSNFEPSLQASYPDIRAYVGKGITDKSAILNFSFSPSGIQTMIFRAGTGSEYIEPYTKDRSVYVIFDSKTRLTGELPFVCSTEDVELVQDLQRNANVSLANNEVYKTMRMALSCTGEYAQYHGGTVAGALAAMNATMTRCNGIFEKDLAVKLIIIANNNLVIYTNATTDPYSPASGIGNWNTQLQNTLTSVIGEANYDIGHLFGGSGGGGNAGCIGCVCVDGSKGRGITSPANGEPEGDTFDIDYVAHELGHQMGANHTFTHTGENNSVNVEPGSGSTIMAYAGIGGGGTDMQSNSDDYFAYRSIFQIQTNLSPKTCPISTSLSVTNPKPLVVAGSAYTIPVSTAFKLEGSATGTVGEILTYNWEQNNDATTVGGITTFPSPTKTDGPNFRSVVPNLSPIRYMPNFQSVLDGQLVTPWETVSSVPRTLNFTLTVRDNVLGGGQTNTGGKVITVVDAGGAFQFTNPNTNVSWSLGSTQTLTWNVAGTTSNGINTLSVNILISTDGGTTFTSLVANTANDGSETVTMPNSPTLNCKIMIEAVGNIFYAVSKNIALGYTIVTTCNTYNYSTPISIFDQAAGNYTTATLNVPVGGVISDINVFNNLTHEYFSDVQTDISSPQNPATFIKLFNRSCGNTNGTLNLNFNDDGTAINCTGGTTLQNVVPGSALLAFNGQNSQGTWTFRVYDNFTGDTGTVNSWGIEVCTQTITLSNPENTLQDFALYPNPNKGNFTVKFLSVNSDDVTIDVYDMRGRQIYTNEFSNTGNFNESIDLNTVQSGVYLVSVSNGGTKLVKRIIVE